MSVKGAQLAAMGVPLGLIFLIVTSIVAITYLQPRGDWVVAYYGHTPVNALKAAANDVTAIAGYSEQHNSTLVYLKTDAQRQALKDSGALLLDPEGVPLCTTPASNPSSNLSAQKQSPI